VAPQYELLAAKHVDVTFLKVDIDLPAVAATVAAARVSAVARRAAAPPLPLTPLTRCASQLLPFTETGNW